MTLEWSLHGSRRQHRDAWPELYHRTSDWTAAWADNHGFHLEPMPTAAPVTSHLWAWSTDHWLRIRIDGALWWAALLSPSREAFAPAWKREDIDEPTINRILHWAKEDGRIQQYNGPKEIFEDLKYIQLLPHRPTTAPFIGTTDSLSEELQNV